MPFNIQLYSTDPSLNAEPIVRACLALIDFDVLRVDRSIGPEDYFERNVHDLATGIMTFPPSDIEGREYSDRQEVAQLVRPNSVLSVSYAYSESKRWSEIVKAVSEYSCGTKNFFGSDTGFSFGPSDLCERQENADGELAVRLIAVRHFSYFLTCDEFDGSRKTIRESFENAPELLRFRSELEEITGPLTLHLKG